MNTPNGNSEDIRNLQRTKKAHARAQLKKIMSEKLESLCPSNAADCSSCPDAAAIPWLEGIRAMVRDRQYEVTQMMDDLDPKKCPIENEAWQRVKRELEPVADLCNRMIYRIRRGESGQTNDQAEASGTATKDSDS